MAATAQWKFLRRLPGFPISNGDITRMFNTGDSSPPRSFSSLVDRSNSDAVSAVIYGREGIANCLDASQARADGHGSLGLDFDFRTHRGTDARRMRQALDLGTLGERITRTSAARKELGLGSDDCLDLGPAGDLRTLTVVERRGGGMRGALEDDRSVLAQALINVGEAQRSVGAAGSYGYGKAAVAQASRIRTVIAYTCVPSTSPKAVSRRLVGVTYWGMHDVGSERYTGWTLFGSDDGDKVRALEDSDADALASSLGLELRDPTVPDDQGTTFLLVDPVFDALQLRGAIELYWWPLLQRTRPITLDVKITDDGQVLDPPTVTDDHELLGQFVRAFARAEKRRDDGEDVRADKHVVLGGQAGVTSLEVRDPASTVAQSLIAQMRSPLMVVSYDRIEAATQPLLGVFVSHETTNDNLRSVEPAEHDKWHRRNVAGLNASRQDIEISQSVVEERKNAAAGLRPAEPDPVYGLSAFSDHFPSVDVKVARPRPPRPRQIKQRLVRVNLVHDGAGGVHEVERPTRVHNTDGSLSAKGEVKFWLDPERAKRVGRSSLDATITIGAQVAEDGSSSLEPWPVVVEQTIRGTEATFTRVSGPGESPARFEGRFTVGQPVHFFVESSPYQPDWTLNLIFDCSPWDIAAPAGGSSSTEEI